ncbi:NTP transferase domain-containing protein [Flaviflexus huanghaiensis]|uniref:NTP transferase domain-containing protein n=1 Tax=Flaviflexus huanghaiensis TaxID=1111473 RepID=UPI0015FCEC2D|nr:NTP transferase domain-containing protein [Flaviflexus huanghaiensis]
MRETSQARPTVIVLAAGAGTRMKSTTPKVLHEVCGRSLVGHVLHAASAVDPERLVVVVRHERDRVAAHISDIAPHATIADQDEVPGTGRAVWCGLEALPADLTGPVLVTAADTPLLDGDTLVALMAAHEGHDITVLTTRVPDPTGYGRIVRDEKGIISSIVEHRDATPEQLEIDEINSSMYVFDAALLRSMLSGLGTDNAQGEMYLTDVISGAYAEGLRLGSYVGDPLCVEGVNDRVQLANLRAIMNRRLLENAMREGTTIEDPNATWVDVGVTFEPDSLVRPGSYLTGTTSVATGATVGPHVYLHSVEVGPDAHVSFARHAHTSLSADATKKDGLS